MLVAVIAVGTVALGAVVGLLLGRARGGGAAELPGAPSPATIKVLEDLGTRDGEAGVPNSWTLDPFPTPALNELYRRGERVRAELDEAHLAACRRLRIRARVSAERAEVLAKKAAAIGLDSPGAAEARAQADAAAIGLAATLESLKAADEEHNARLGAVDASTAAQVAAYWGANLRARDRSEPEPVLDSAIVPSPAEWRASHGAEIDADGVDLSGGRH